MGWKDTDEGVLPLIGGPYDGGEIDTDDIFAGRVPDRIAVARGGPHWLIASYDLSADGSRYRFTGSTSAAASR